MLHYWLSSATWVEIRSSTLQWCIICPKRTICYSFYRNLEIWNSWSNLFETRTQTAPKTRERVPETLWKPHKSKEKKILHRNYVHFFSNSEKNIFFFDVEKKSKNFGSFFFSKNPKMKKFNFQFWDSRFEIFWKKIWSPKIFGRFRPTGRIFKFFVFFFFEKKKWYTLFFEKKYFWSKF